MNSITIIRKRREVSVIVLLVFLFFVLTIISESYGEVLPADRKINWDPGIPGGIPKRTTICANVKNAPYNAVGDGVADDTTAIQNAVNACAVTQVVYVPAGTYKTTDTINIGKGITLRGDGPNLTKIKHYSSVDKGRIIQIGTQTAPGTSKSVLSGFTKGSTSITLNDATSFAVGNYIGLDQLNDPNLPVTQTGCEGPCTWCGREGTGGTRALGQVLKIIAKNGNTLTVDPPLYYTYSSAYTPEVSKITTVEYAGIEDLYVENVNTSTPRNIRIDNCAYCWVKDIESYNSAQMHLSMLYSYRSEVRGSYFHHANAYAPNSGYGVFIGRYASANLIEDNIFYYLSPAMMLGWGASGNVFGYNYSYYGLQTSNPTWFFPDAVFHGAHTYMNLFEGNKIQGLSLDFTWGSHSHNTFFRNHISMALTPSTVVGNINAVRIEYNNRYMNFVGNVFGTPGITGTYQIESMACTSNEKSIFKVGYGQPNGACSGDCNPTGNDGNVLLTLYRHGNYDYVTQSTQWDSTVVDHTLPSSLYLLSKPAFFKDVQWPPIGSDGSTIVGTIPSEKRFNAPRPPVMQ